MTTILPSARSSWDIIGQQIGENLNQNLPGAIQQGLNRGMLQNSLGNISNIANSGGSPLDITLAAMQAGAGIPGSERYLGQIIPMLQQIALSNASQKAPLAGEGAPSAQMRAAERQSMPMEPMQPRQALPGFMGQADQTSKFFPDNIGPQGGPGNVPQAATTGVKQPLMNRAEKVRAAKELAAERNKAGIPTTAKQALDEINEGEQDKRDYNKQIDEELAQRTTGQQTYGQRAVEYLKGVYPEANPEIESIFQKIGETASAKGDSEADINHFLAKEADRFKNAIVNVQKDLDAPRTKNFFQRAFNGTYKNFDKSAADLRKHIKPLIDLGLYDTARRLLQEKGYGIEERDMIINPLNDRVLSAANQLPKVNTLKIGSPNKGRSYVPQLGAVEKIAPTSMDKENLKSAITQMKEADNNFSLVLARKAVEDRGFDWRDFKDALNELLDQGFQLSQDQQIQLGNLDTPPLSVLESILESVNIIGR